MPPPPVWWRLCPTTDHNYLVEPRQRHYRNLGIGGECLYATTTCLDFGHAFESPDGADLMALSSIDDCRHYDSPLSALVGMLQAHGVMEKLRRVAAHPRGKLL